MRYKPYAMMLNKQQVDAILLEAEKKDEFDHMLLLTLKSTGRRIGELYGVQDKQEIGRLVVGDRIIYYQGKRRRIDRTIPQYKKLKNWKYGVKVKDIDFSKGVMKVWVLKRRQHTQDETILSPELTRKIWVWVKKNRLGLDDYVFRKPGRSMRYLQNLIKKYGRLANIPLIERREGKIYTLSLHSLRHYFITELKRRGWHDEDIIKVTGHKKTQTLRIYDHIVSTDIKEKILDTIKDM